MKLRNVEVPKLLPPTLLASLKHVGTPIRTPTGSMSPVEGYKQFLPPVANISIQQQQPQQYQQQPILQNQPMAMHPQTQMMNIAQQQQHPIMVAPNSQAMSTQAIPQQQQFPPDMMMMSQPQMIVQPQQIMTQPHIVPMSSTVPIIPTGTVMPLQPPMMTNTFQISSAQVPQPLLDQLSNGSLLDSLVQVQPSVIAPGTALPAAPTPTPPQSGNASRSMSFSEKAPSVPESP